MGGAHDSLDRDSARHLGTFSERSRAFFQESFSLWLLLHTLYGEKEPGSLGHALWIQNYEATMLALSDLTGARKKWPRSMIRSVHDYLRPKDHSPFVEAMRLDDERKQRIASSMQQR